MTELLFHDWLQAKTHNTFAPGQTTPFLFVLTLLEGKRECMLLLFFFNFLIAFLIYLFLFHLSALYDDGSRRDGIVGRFLARAASAASRQCGHLLFAHTHSHIHTHLTHPHIPFKAFRLCGDDGDVTGLWSIFIKTRECCSRQCGHYSLLWWSEK
jgi:hypothetical protein